MKVNRSEIDQILKFYLNNLTKDDRIDIKNKIKSAMMTKGYNEFETNRIINLNIYPNLLMDIDMFALCYVISISDTGFIIDKYLTDKEIQIGTAYTKEKNSANDNEMKFDNVIESIEDKQWITVKPIQDIAEFMNNYIIEYDEEFQRETIKRYNKKKDQVIEELNINKNKVNEISSSIRDGRYFGEAISIVCLKTGEESFTYSEIKKSIKIIADGKTKIFCPDGFHRILAFCKTVEFSGEIKQNTEVRILHLTEEETAEYINQIDKHTPLLLSLIHI